MADDTRDVQRVDGWIESLSLRADDRPDRSDDKAAAALIALVTYVDDVPPREQPLVLCRRGRGRGRGRESGVPERWRGRRGLGLAVGAALALSSSGIAAAVTGDPFSPVPFITQHLLPFASDGDDSHDRQRSEAPLLTRDALGRGEQPVEDHGARLQQAQPSRAATRKVDPPAPDMEAPRTFDQPDEPDQPTADADTAEPLTADVGDRSAQELREPSEREPRTEPTSGSLPEPRPQPRETSPDEKPNILDGPRGESFPPPPAPACPLPSSTGPDIPPGCIRQPPVPPPNSPTSPKPPHEPDLPATPDKPVEKPASPSTDGPVASPRHPAPKPR